jgi:hypothetical protein
LGRVARWMIAAIVTLAFFGLCWWSADQLGVRSDISLALASLVSAIALALLAWWAGRDDRHRAAQADGETRNFIDHSSRRQTVGSVSGDLIINSFGAMDLRGASTSADTGDSHDSRLPNELSPANLADISSRDPQSSPLIRWSVTIYQAEGITRSENLEIYDVETAARWINKNQSIQQSPGSIDE